MKVSQRRRDDWNAYTLYEPSRNQFVTDETYPSLKQFAMLKGWDVGEFTRHATRAGWLVQRDEYQARLRRLMAEASEPTSKARLKYKLTRIESMQEVAYEEAIKGQYRNSAQAAEAFISLEKLQRLLTDQPTQIISVEQVSRAVMALYAVVLEEVRDPEIRARISQRVNALSLHDLLQLEQAKEVEDG